MATTNFTKPPTLVMGYGLFVIFYLLFVGFNSCGTGKMPVPKNGAKCKFVPTYLGFLAASIASALGRVFKLSNPTRISPKSPLKRVNLNALVPPPTPIKKGSRG